MTGRHVVLYYAWSRPAEMGAPLAVIEDRFPTLFESRRMLFPRFEEFADPKVCDQGVGGFLDHIMKRNFAAFAAQAAAETGNPVVEIERVGSDGVVTPLGPALLDAADTLIVISFDSITSGQEASAAEIAALAAFLADPDHVAFICPHHHIGHAPDLPHEALIQAQVADFLHHGDPTIPPRQGFGGFGRSLLAALGMPVENRFGLRPALDPDGLPAAIERFDGLDRLHLLEGVRTFNSHPHLPHFERLDGALENLGVLARQRIDLTAPAHPFAQDGRDRFDALLISRPGAFGGCLLVGDATLWSSTAGGVDSLRRMWSNLVGRPRTGRRTMPASDCRARALAAALHHRQAAFAEAILDPARPVPSGLVGPDGKPSARRFAVYRNNVVLGLVEALKAAFPAVLRLVGEPFFEGMARCYTAIDPPRSPMMFDYGAGFADFVGTFPPAATLPYLCDVARLERAWVEAYHSAEAEPCDPAALAGIAGVETGGLRLALHPSLRVVRSAFPAVAIWQMNVAGGIPRPVDLGCAEDALVLRPAAEVEVRILPEGAAAFVAALAAGRLVIESLKAALADSPRFDVGGALAGLLIAGALTGWTCTFDDAPHSPEVMS